MFTFNRLDFRSKFSSFRCVVKRYFTTRGGPEIHPINDLPADGSVSSAMTYWVDEKTKRIHGDRHRSAHNTIYSAATKIYWLQSLERLRWPSDGQNSRQNHGVTVQDNVPTLSNRESTHVWSWVTTCVESLQTYALKWVQGLYTFILWRKRVLNSGHERWNLSHRIYPIYDTVNTLQNSKALRN